MTRRLLTSVGAEARLAQARSWLSEQVELGEVLVIGATRRAADDLVRECVEASDPGRPRGVIGVRRHTLARLASELAAEGLGRHGLTPLGRLGAEALAARAIHACRQERPLAYFEPVAELPGFARALARTARELRDEDVPRSALAATDAAGADLSRLLGRIERELEQGRLADPARILALATERAEGGPHPLLGPALLLVDVSATTRRERALMAAVASRARAVLAVACAGDEVGVEALAAALGASPERLETAPPATALQRIQRRVFASGRRERHEADPSFSFFSAPNEDRECVEIARQILAAAREGRRFDRVAVVLRSTEAYQPLLEDALRRAEIPAFFTVGTTRPNPAGRAFLALLDCAAQDLSATRFGEYLSLGQVPKLDEAGAPARVEAAWAAPSDETQLVFRTREREPTPEPGPEPPPPPPGEGAEFDGTLRVPALWERMIGEARVVKGQARWRARLAGLLEELALRTEALERVGGDAADADLRRLGLRRARIENLRRFALPIVDALAELPDEAHWGHWLDALDGLAVLALREPDGVRGILAELRPMADVGPVGLAEVRQALADRLGTLRREPPARRFGRVFVGSVDEIAGRSFELVFVPGLAEGIFPRKSFEDPLLLDVRRRAVDPRLADRERRFAEERLRLRLAAGAAETRLIASFPRIDLGTGRARVPSFYLLDLIRAAEGHIPRLPELAQRAADGADARLGWPAPRDRDRAIDAAEHDLAVLAALVGDRETRRVRAGRAVYLLDVNAALARSLRARGRRWLPRWFPVDGLVASPDDAHLREALEAQRPTARSYAPTALEDFATCPYRFFLRAVVGLRAEEDDVAFERMHPLTRGQLFHRMQFHLLQEELGRTPPAPAPSGAPEAEDALQAALRASIAKLESGEPIPAPSSAPVSEAEDAALAARIHAVVQRIAEAAERDLAPLLPGVFREEVALLERDLLVWARGRRADVEAGWLPLHAELGFGVQRRPGSERDPASTEDPARVLEGALLRGAIDLVEVRGSDGAVRVTDHKTGRVPDVVARSRGDARIFGGRHLQPVLYALAAEAVLARPATSGRLSYCTERGGHAAVEVRLDDATRWSARRLFETIDEAVAGGFLPAAPAEGACDYCDARVVCGPNEPVRIRRKSQRELVPLMTLRSLK